MTGWPSNWHNAALKQAGIEQTQFARDVLNLWQQSTPVEPWSNNPLGMPYRGYSPRVIPSTTYALFSNMQSFRDALQLFLRSHKGGLLYGVLISAESLPDAWREIHALKWPANKTESEYPAAILNRISSDHANRIAARATRKHKSSGTTTKTSTLHEQVISGHRIMTQAIGRSTTASEAIQQILRETP